MRILLTRPQADSEKLSAELRYLDHECLIEPLLQIDFFKDEAAQLKNALDNVQALLVTSANGIEAFAKNSPRKNLPIYAVGDATARKARALGFARVESANGNVDDLAALVDANLDPKQGDLLHIAGTKVAGDLATQLDRSGFAYRRIVLYKAQQRTDLSFEAIDAISKGHIDAVMVFSPRTAETLTKLMKRSALQDKTVDIIVFCLSPEVAGALDNMTWKQVLIASTPTEAALIALVEQAKKAKD